MLNQSKRSILILSVTQLLSRSIGVERIESIVNPLTKKGENKMRKQIIISIAAIVMIVALASAQSVPNLIDYQGKVTDSDGNPINGTVSITFSIYADSTGGTALWSETQDPVNVSDGLFHLFLGAENPIPDDLFNDPDRWIGINVNNDGEMTPRSRIGSVAYAQTDGDWVVDDDDIYRENGNVGIGTTSPNAKLDINAPEGTLPLKLKQNASMFPYAPSLVTFSTQEGDIGNIGGHLINDSNTFLVGGLDNTSFGIYANNSFASPNLFIDTDGNIGIGIIPQNSLNKLLISSDLDESLWYTHSIMISTPQENDVMRIGFVDQTSLGYVTAQIESARNIGSGGYLAFKTRPVGSRVDINENMRIDELGNVGIGTTSPVAKLDLNPSSSNQVSLHLGETTRDIGYQSGTNLQIGQWDGTTWDDKIIIDNNGNVGIGTTSPNAKLDINAPEGTLPLKLKQNASMFPYAPSLVTFATQEGDIGNIGGHLINDSNTFIVGGLDNTSFGIYANNNFESPNLFIDTDGKVGIGTMSPFPSTKLQISFDLDESMWWTSALQISTPQENDVMRIGFTDETNGYVTAQIESALYSGGGYLAFKTRQGAGDITERMRIDNSGNVGIGTNSPGAKLHVSGTPGTDGIMFPDGTIQTTAATPRTYDSGWFAISSGGNPTLYTKTHNLGTTMVISQCWLSDTSDGSGISVLVQGGHTLNTGGDWGHADSHLEGLTTTQISLYVQNKLHDGRLNTTSGYARIIMLALE